MSVFRPIHKGCGGTLDYHVYWTDLPVITYVVCFACGMEWQRRGNPSVFHRQVDPCEDGYAQIEEESA